ncbi:hypothetical protein CYMTET_14124 [Cymbomonas tetramitiformis]|uniref:Uncharacterized protein n=1 Tax=Cymbomonas tetramitiformis TaxID=36881 RepID=A0AAE0GH87_9CHLO|nr:hypothetical protein CYMTET_14124 [Cymbomonas tetramitiformis]
MVRLWQSAATVAPAKQLAKIRTSIAAVAKKVHNFIFRASYLCKVPLPEAVSSAAVKDFFLQCVNTKCPEGATRNFVRQRTRVVRTAKQKISALFCNLNRVAVCVDEADCRCDSLDRELPRRDGHVCFRTTELHGKFSDFNRSLKDTPRQANETADYLVLTGTTDFLNQLNLFETVSVAAIRKLLPWKCNVDGSSYLLVENFTEEIFFVAVCGANGLVVQAWGGASLHGPAIGGEGTGGG